MSGNESYRDKYFEEKIIGLGKLIKANFINVNDKLEDIDNEVKKINSRVSTLEKITNNRGIVVKEFYGYVGKFKWCKKYWYVILIALSLFILMILNLYQIGAVKNVIQWIINIAK